GFEARQHIAVGRAPGAVESVPCQPPGGRRPGTNPAEFWCQCDAVDTIEGTGSRRRQTDMTSLQRHSAVDIAVITIREDETDAVLGRISGVQAVPGSNRTYAVGELGNVHGFSVSIASVRTPAKGQLPAQETARNVIEDLDPAWIAVVGICGAVPDSEFTLGDVIVASRLHAFTIGAVDEGEPVHFSDVGGPLRRQAEDLVGYIRALGSDLSGWDADQMIGYPRPDVR